MSNYTSILSRLKEKQTTSALRALFYCNSVQKSSCYSLVQLMKNGTAFKGYFDPILYVAAEQFNNDQESYEMVVRHFKLWGIEMIEGYDSQRSIYHDICAASPDIRLVA